MNIARKLYLKLRYPRMLYFTMCPVCAQEFEGQSAPFMSKPKKAERLAIDQHMKYCQYDR